MLRKICLAALFLFTESAIAAPIALDPHLCYIQYADGQVTNLDRLCGQKAIAPSATEVAPTTTTTTTRSTSSGVCTFSSDRDSRGRLCGGRASARRRGGR